VLPPSNGVLQSLALARKAKMRLFIDGVFLKHQSGFFRFGKLRSIYRRGTTATASGGSVATHWSRNSVRKRFAPLPGHGLEVGQSPQAKEFKVVFRDFSVLGSVRNRVDVFGQRLFVVVHRQTEKIAQADVN